MQNHSTALMTPLSDNFPAHGLTSLVRTAARASRGARLDKRIGDAAARSFFGPMTQYPTGKDWVDAEDKFDALHIVEGTQVAVPSREGLRDRIRLERGWRFRVGDPADAAELSSRFRMRPIQGGFLSPLEDDSAVLAPRGSQTEEGRGSSISWVQPGFADSEWSPISSALDSEVRSKGSAEITPVWYRQSFWTPASDGDARFILEIEDLSAGSQLWINGRCLTRGHAGLTTVRRDLTPYLVATGANILVVRVAVTSEGAGPCRTICLVKTGNLHSGAQGATVDGALRSGDRAVLSIGTPLHNEHENAQRGMLVTTVLDPAGRAIAEERHAFHIFGGDRILLGQRLTLSDASWLAEDPGSYLVCTRIFVNDAIRDEDITAFDFSAALSSQDSSSFILI